MRVFILAVCLLLSACGYTMCDCPEEIVCKKTYRAYRNNAGAWTDISCKCPVKPINCGKPIKE